MTNAADDRRARIVAVAMELAAERGWRAVTLADVAHRAGVSLGGLYREFPTRAHLLVGLTRIADAAVLADTTAPDPDESTRDRLFDVMMRRFDALLPYREGLAAVLRDLPREPFTAVAFARPFARSMAWMLRAAGVDPERPGGAGLVAGLGAVHARVMRVFVRDDTADLARTMAALDAELRRAESWLAGFRRRGRKDETPPEPSATPPG